MSLSLSLSVYASPSLLLYLSTYLLWIPPFFPLCEGESHFLSVFFAPDPVAVFYYAC